MSEKEGFIRVFVIRTIIGVDPLSCEDVSRKIDGELFRWVFLNFDFPQKW